MCAFKEEELSVLISVTLMKGITGYKTVTTIGITFCMQVKGSTMRQRLEREISFLCLFVYCNFFFLPSEFLVFSFLLFLLSAFFSIRIFPSASAIHRYPVRVLQTPLESNARVRIPPFPATPPMHITGAVNRVLYPNMQLFFVVFCRWNLSPSYPIRVHHLVARVLPYIFQSYYNIANRLRSDDGDGYEIVKNV